MRDAIIFRPSGRRNVARPAGPGDLDLEGERRRGWKGEGGGDRAKGAAGRSGGGRPPPGVGAGRRLPGRGGRRRLAQTAARRDADRAAVPGPTLLLPPPDRVPRFDHAGTRPCTSGATFTTFSCPSGRRARPRRATRRSARSLRSFSPAGSTAAFMCVRPRAAVGVRARRSASASAPRPRGGRRRAVGRAFRNRKRVPFGPGCRSSGPTRRRRPARCAAAARAGPRAAPRRAPRAASTSCAAARARAAGGATGGRWVGGVRRACVPGHRGLRAPQGGLSGRHWAS